MKKIITGLFISTLALITLPSNVANASYEENTEYRIEIGAFIGEVSANDALQRIQSEKGWWATVEPTGKSIPYFQVESGGFGGEENVQNILNQFKSTTGLEATYKPIGSPEYHQKIISGSYFGEEAVKGITQEFTNNTGIPATYEQNEQSVLAKRIFSGAYYGEDNVKKIIQDFQSATGLTATYEPTGNYQEYLQVVSGGFYGEQLTNSILQEFKTSTGINASFEPIQFKEIVSIETGGFYGEENVQAIVNQINVDLGITASYELTSKDQLYIIAFEQLSEENTKKVKNYLDNKNWWYTLVPTGSKVPTHYQIVTDSLLDKAMINKALQFFNNHNWWASTNQTGKKTYTYFNIVSNNLIDSEANKGLKFFTDRKLWATIESTNEKVFPYYNLVTDPLLDKEKLDKAKSFFNSKNLWYTSEITGEPIYSAFYIVSQELLGVENNNKVLKFFSDNNWWAASIPTGKKEKYYNIYTGGFIGYDNAASNAQMITDQYGWWATTKEVNKGPKFTYTNYNVTLNQMLNMQLGLSIPPQTDKYRNNPAYINSNNIIIDDGGLINGSIVNLRTSPELNSEDNISATVTNGEPFILLDGNIQGASFKGSTKWYKVEYNNKVLYVHSYLAKIGSRVGKTTTKADIKSAQNTISHTYSSFDKGTLLTILEEGKDWHKVNLGPWRNATQDDIMQSMDPSNFVNDEKQKFQFLDLSKPTGTPVTVLNNYLVGKGILEGKGQAFVDASIANGISDLYLISHALLETGNGTSELSSGVQYNGVTVYNMFGIGAYDTSPLESGAKRAYEEGWTTPYKAIVGGAKFIGNDYIKGINNYNTVQNTLYKMRWNTMLTNNGYVAVHQYATDIGWASKQLNSMYNLYQQLGSYTLYLDIPVYKN